MNSRYTHVVKMFSTIAHDTRSQQSFYSHGNITGPRGHDENRALAHNLSVTLDSDHAGDRMKFCESRLFSRRSLHRGKYFRVGARNQNVVLAILLRQHGA